MSKLILLINSMRTSISTFLVLLSFFAGTSIADAQTTTILTTPSATQSVHYPIQELGNCSSKDSCKLYCSKASNIQACLVFAETHQLMTTIGVQKALLLQSLPGPGGCRGQQCIDYCSTSNHIEACAAFANRIRTISNSIQIRAAAKAEPALKSGPGGCRSGAECAVFCRSHQDDCRNFAAKIASSSPPGENSMTPPQQMRPHTAPLPPKKPTSTSDTSSSVVSYLGAAVFSGLLLFFHL